MTPKMRRYWKEPQKMSTSLFVPTRAARLIPLPVTTSSTPTWAARSAKRTRCRTMTMTFLMVARKDRRGRADSIAPHRTSWRRISQAPATTCHRLHSLANAWASPQFQIINSIRLGPGEPTILFRILQLNVILWMRTRWLWGSSFKVESRRA